MKCFTFHDGSLLEGIRVTGKDDPHVFLGQKGPNSLYQVIRLDRDNMPFIKNGVIKYAFPVKKKHISSDGLKIERVYLSNPFRSKDKLMIRILTSTSTKNKKKDGRWFKLASKELDVRGKVFTFPSVVSRGRGCSPGQETTWADEILIMPHGTAVKVVPEGCARSEERVVGNLHGDIFSMPFEEFDRDGFEELSKTTREEFQKEEMVGPKGLKEQGPTLKEFDDQVNSILSKLDVSDELEPEMAVGSVAGKCEPAMAAEGGKTDNSVLLHESGGSAVS